MQITFPNFCWTHVYNLFWSFFGCVMVWWFWMCRRRLLVSIGSSPSTSFSPRGWRSCRTGRLTPATCCRLTALQQLTKMFLTAEWSSWRYRKLLTISNSPMFLKFCVVMNLNGCLLLQALLTARQEKEIQLKMLITRGESVQRNTSAEGVPLIQKQIQELKDSWDALLSAAILCKRFLLFGCFFLFFLQLFDNWGLPSQCIGEHWNADQVPQSKLLTFTFAKFTNSKWQMSNISKELIFY